MHTDRVLPKGSIKVQIKGALATAPLYNKNKRKDANLFSKD